jgi:hypothetical protein
MVLFTIVLLLIVIVIETISFFLLYMIKKSRRFVVGVEASEYISDQYLNQKKIDVATKHAFEPRPYCLYWNSSNFFNNGYQQTDANGFRYKGYNIVHQKSVFRALVYGGSTTFSDHFVYDPKKCWPYLMEHLFNKSNLNKIEVINAGLNWATSAELLSHFIFEGKNFHPDLLIIEGPGNDSLPIAHGDKSSDYRATRSSITWQVRKYESFFLYYSKFFKLFYTFWLRDANLLRLDKPNELDISEQNQLLLTTYPKAYEDNINTFIQLAIQLKIKVVLIGFLPSHFVVNEGKKAVYKAMNEILLSISRKFPNDVSYIDLKLSDFAKGDFADPGHLNEGGEIKKAQMIFDKLLLNL